jgi:ribonuclease Z
MKKHVSLLLIACAALGCSSAADEPGTATVGKLPPPDSTMLVMLGTGTPNPEPERSGPALAIVAGGQPYLVDCGPGIVRRAAAAELAGISALAMPKLTKLFVTHLHSDHTAGYADIILTPWVLDREQPLEVFGPPGIGSMTNHILAAYAEDIDIRIHGSQPQNATGIRVNAHEIEPGEIYRDDNVTVTAFPVVHGDWRHAFGYRFEAADRSIVVTGDTVPTEAVVEACNGCDILVHEVYAKTGLDRRPADWQAYYRDTHTSGIELGEIAAKANPKLLVLYHQLLSGATEAELMAEIRRSFDGPVAFAKDLDVY